MANAFVVVVVLTWFLGFYCASVNANKSRPFDVDQCSKGEFNCYEGLDEDGTECIDDTLICDRHGDCANKRDEEDCDPVLKCPDDFFPCSNERKCIYNKYICNKIAACDSVEFDSMCYVYTDKSNIWADESGSTSTLTSTSLKTTAADQTQTDSYTSAVPRKLDDSQSGAMYVTTPDDRFPDDNVHYETIKYNRSVAFTDSDGYEETTSERTTSKRTTSERTTPEQTTSEQTTSEGKTSDSTTDSSTIRIQTDASTTKRIITTSFHSSANRCVYSLPFLGLIVTVATLF